MYCRRDLGVTIYVVEVGYTGDMYLHDTIAAKKSRHQQLCISLSAFGWANVWQDQFVVGQTVVMLTNNLVTLQALGVVQDRSILAQACCFRSSKFTAILSCFPSCAEAAQPPFSSTHASQQPPQDSSPPAQMRPSLQSDLQSDLAIPMHAPTSCPLTAL